ncbi:MAG: response regulator [Firmicutes bacterium]|nr:response regulator [Bacillota bacterium]
MTADKADLLIVDDQVGVRMLISEALLEIGYVAAQASRGREALEKLKVEEYHLILLDVKMPGINGVETLNEIRKINPEVPVVLMTAYEDLYIMEEAERLGVKHCLRKPFDLEELRTLARQLIPRVGDVGCCAANETC